MSSHAKPLKDPDCLIPADPAINNDQLTKGKYSGRKKTTNELVQSKGDLNPQNDNSDAMETNTGQENMRRSARHIKPMQRFQGGSAGCSRRLTCNSSMDSESLEAVSKTRCSRDQTNNGKKAPRRVSHQNSLPKERRDTKDGNHSLPSNSEEGKPPAVTTMNNSEVVTKSKAGVNPEHDKDEFEVEKIMKHRVCPNDVMKIRYLVKWLGYTSEENTEESECSFLTYLPVYKYWAEVLNADKDDVLAMGAMIQHELQQDNVRFYVYDALFYKKLLHKDFLERNGWMNLIHPFRLSSFFPSMQDLLYTYGNRLVAVTRLCACFPDYKITNSVDDVLPMPFSNFLPFSVTPAMNFMNEEEKDCSPISYYGILPSDARMNATVRTMVNIHNGEFSKVARNSMICEELRMQATFLPRFSRHHSSQIEGRTQLELRRHPDSYWELVTLQDIEMGTFISPICGEVVPVSEAEQCFRTEGEMIAFKHFLKLPDQTSLCLDRRRRSDFTRYLSHSCYSNCAIHSVVLENRTGEWAPMLFLVARDRIPKNSVLTADFFFNLSRTEKFKDLGQVDWNARMKLNDDRVDHVWCECDAGPSRCRGVLWAEEFVGKAYTDDKEKKLNKTVIGSITFNGLECIEHEWETNVDA